MNNIENFSVDNLDMEVKIFFLTQAFLNKNEILLYTTKQKEAYHGKIYDLNNKKIYFSVNKKLLIFSYEEILNLVLADNFE